MTTRAATGPRPNRTPTPVDVIARDRAYEAHKLRVAGADWAEVAARTGYADGRVASLAVTAFLQKTAVEQGPDHRRDVLRQELDRLDALQFAYWPAAVIWRSQRGEHRAEVHRSALHGARVRPARQREHDPGPAARNRWHN